MRSLRTKIILAILLVTLLPVLPLYFLVTAMLENSLELGLNREVESALSRAMAISKDMYSHFRSEVLQAAGEVAEELAQTDRLNPIREERFARWMRRGDGSRLSGLAVYDAHGHLLAASPWAGRYLPDPFLRSGDIQQPRLVGDLGGDSAFVAVAPIRQNRGFVVAIRRLPASFSRGAQRIIEVNQMFKTLDYVQQELHRPFVQAFFVVYGPIALISIVLGFFLSKRLAAPLAKLAEGTREVAAGNWNFQVQGTTRDEVGQLVAAFNEMVNAIREKQAQILELEKMAAWREIARVLAHEIKNPLTPIKLTAQEMLDRYSGEDKEYKKLLQECAGIIHDEIGSLQELVREFSDFARMPKLNPVPGNLNDLVQDVSKLYPDVDIRLLLQDGLPEIDFDYQQMRRVLVNFFANSVDSLAGRQKQEITICTAVENGRIRLDFSDTGCGIPAERLEKIFEPYFSTKKSGVGLGLAIVKRIIEEHGGSIRVASTEGAGTTFTVFLPRVCAGES